MIEACQKCLDPETRISAGSIAKSAVETLRNTANELWDNTDTTLQRAVQLAPELESKKDELIGAQAGLIFQTAEAAEELEASLATIQTIDCQAVLSGSDSVVPYCPRAELIKHTIKQLIERLEAPHG